MMITKERLGKERGTCYSFHPRYVELTHFFSVPLEPGAKADRILERSDSSLTVS